MSTCICNLSSTSHISPMLDKLSADLVRFHGARPVEISFTRNQINNIQVNDPKSLPCTDVTMIAPVPNQLKSPSDCLVELMLAIHRLRMLGAISFHIIFVVTPFDGSGSRISPTTPGFKLLSNHLNSTPDIRKVTILGPHSSQIEDMINVPRRIISHREILDLPNYLNDRNWTDVKFISPDIGGYYNTLHVSSKLTSKPISCVSDGASLPEDVTDQNVIIFDDMCVTGNKILLAYEAVKALNPATITIAVTHVLHDQGVTALSAILNSDPIVTVIISDTLLTLNHPNCIIRPIQNHIFDSFWSTNEHSR